MHPTERADLPEQRESSHMRLNPFASSVFVTTGSSRPRIDNTRRFARVLYRWHSYSRIVTKTLSKVPLSTLARSHFPLWFKDAPVPPFLTVEFTNICNLRCTYCTSPLGLRARGMMNGSTFSRLVEQVKAGKIKRVRVVGNGEPTLHPDFPAYIRRLATVTPFLSMVTNLQRLPDGVLDAMLTAPVSLVEVSVDGGNREEYESSRLGGHFDRLQENLRRLKRRRNELKSSTLINIRLMLRPSHQPREAAIVRGWRPFADCVMRQYVIQRRELVVESDAYESVHRSNEEYPRCSLPFKDLDITWTGDVPLCHYSAAQMGEPGLLLGNINTRTIEQLWNSETMKQYRNAHRQRIPEQMPICLGCAAV